MGYWQGQAKHLRKSLRIKDILITAGLDYLFYAILVAIFYLFVMFVSKRVSILQGVNPMAVLSSGGQEAIGTLQTVLLSLVISVVMLYLLFILLHSFFQLLIWGRLIRKTLSIRLYWKVVLSNLAFFIAIIAILLTLLFRNKGISLPPSVVVLLVFMVHFGSVLVHEVIHQESLKKGFFNLFWKGCMFHRFFLAYAIIFLGLFILVNLFNYAKIWQISDLIPIIAIVMYLSWARSYFAEAMK